MNRYAKLGALAVFVVILAVWMRPRTNTWTEEVQLSSGEVISVKRREKYRVDTELGGWRKNVWVETSMLEILDSRTSTPPPSIEIPRLFLMRLDFDPGRKRWVVIGSLETCSGLQSTSGTWPYYEYTFERGAWLRQTISQDQIGVESNLLISKKLAEDGDRVKLDAKRRADSSVGIADHLKQVLRKVPC